MLGRNGERGQILSHEEAVQKWVVLDHCGTLGTKEHTADETGDGTSIDVAIYSRCTDGSEVRDYTIVEGGHAWPGGLHYMPEVLIEKTTKNLGVLLEAFTMKTEDDGMVALVSESRSLAQLRTTMSIFRSSRPTWTLRELLLN